MKTNKAPFTFVKDGYFYFSRRIPSDLKTHYGTDRIVEALRTKSALVARGRALVAAAKLDEYWSHLRMSQAVVPGRKFLQLASAAAPSVHSVQITTSAGPTARTPSPSLTEAVQRYVKMKGQGRGETFKRAAERACGYLIDVVGEKALGDYSRSDALALRDHLVRRGLSGSSVTRVFGSIRAVINFNISELALDLRNPFLGVYYDRNRGVTKRATIPVDAIRQTQMRCMNRAGFAGG